MGEGLDGGERALGRAGFQLQDGQQHLRAAPGPIFRYRVGKAGLGAVYAAEADACERQRGEQRMFDGCQLDGLTEYRFCFTVMAGLQIGLPQRTQNIEIARFLTCQRAKRRSGVLGLAEIQ